jgi:hypothetical protein
MKETGMIHRRFEMGTVIQMHVDLHWAMDRAGADKQEKKIQLYIL